MLRRTTVACVLVALVSSGAAAQGRDTRDVVRFMQTMMAHHAQALTMVALVADRTERPEFKALAEQLKNSQGDQIAAMRRWLAVRHEDIPTPDATHPLDAGIMTGMRVPGMLSESEMMDLEDAKGPPFERLFLTDMIRHHEGALSMIRELSHAPGAGQESETSRFVSSVESDQRADLARMRALLEKLEK